VERALSASRQMVSLISGAFARKDAAGPGLTIKIVLQALTRARQGVPVPVNAFMDKGISSSSASAPTRRTYEQAHR